MRNNFNANTKNNNKGGTLIVIFLIKFGGNENFHYFCRQTESQ